MSRSALAVAAVLFALGAALWWFAFDDNTPESPAAVARPPSAPAPAPGTSGPAPAPAVAAPAEAPTNAVDVSTRDALIRALNARGLDGETLLAGYQEWRVAHGFFDADPLAGVSPENAPGRIYALMSRDDQLAMAEAGDLGAMQAYAAGSLPAEPFLAIQYYSRASKLRSAAAMGEIASVLGVIDALDPGSEGSPNLRRDAAGWALASIRQYGPIMASGKTMALLNELARNPDKDFVSNACGRSLAILADLSAATSGKDTDSLPPVFVAEKNLYARLPCQDTAAPIMPPRALTACSASPARNRSGQPVELWICPEN